MQPSSPPLVLVLSGHDPSGGAGVQADIEAIQACGAQPITLLTCLTVQDVDQVHSVHPITPELLLQQAHTLLEQLTPAAVKVGLVPDAATARAVETILARLEDVPRVIDPILRAGGGRTLAQVEQLRPLLARATLATPNRQEARLLGGGDSPRTGAEGLLQHGVDAVLVTGADEAESDQVVNTLFRPGNVRHYRWPRLPGRFHGSGCTLAAATAARLALGQPLEQALEQAQAYTLEALRQAFRPDTVQALPRRCPRPT